jgi:oligoribonuclease NrnB/cAMP/cGMP phosphodiesterase (DHH superfamily)
VNYHLYFHNDFDGVASGAVMLNFLNSRGDDIVSFTPVDYSPLLKKNWARFKFKEPFIIVDFLYHPKASWWFDHHRTSFINNRWYKEFKSDKNRAFDQTAKSACSLMAEHLMKKFDYSPPKFFVDLVKWADIIDSASYKSAKEAIFGRQPAIKLVPVLELIDGKGKASAKYFEKVIKFLANEPLSRTIQTPIIRREIKKVEKSNREIKRIFKNISFVSGKVVFIDGTRTKNQFSRYIGYYFYPEINYSITLEFRRYCYHLSVGKNPWKREPAGINIGELLSKYGGGGHKTVGGVERKSKPEILRIAGEVIEYLNNNG